MDYAEARVLLDRLPWLLVKPGLTRIRRLLEALGNPERSFPAVHVAGTNGKGSVVAMLDSVLRAAGYRTGRYTSPEVEDFRDRICVDGVWIREAELASGTARLADALFADPDVPSQFEAITAIAFDHFQRAAVDVAVVEVGLGGRFDATNVASPVLCVLTNVTLDHTAILGDTAEKIAWEKAGIAKPGVPLLAGRLAAAVAAVVRAECAAVGAPLVSGEEVVVSCGRRDLDRAEYAVQGAGLPAKVELGLVGGYQRENLQLVLRAVQLLRTAGFAIPSDVVDRGLAAARWPGRAEVVRRRPTVILEGAHNVAGAEQLAHDVARWAPDRDRRWLVLGVLADKDVGGIVQTLVPLFRRVVLCRSASPRALPVNELCARIGEHSVESTCYDSVKDAVRETVARAGPEDVVVVTGSLTVVAEARRELCPG
ncbi:MAG: bifunctional folylpolyglutamate synthase/dihydrofolate synthase [Candidatus Bipolaricaulis sp.]|nr:bifunctional folylpolyglutamate synthase/dihydrofolate synthase [Candidatus Bipolaricaulis sp.]